MDCGPGSLTQLHGYIEQLANLLELMGVSIIVLGVAVATGIFLRDGIRRHEWRDGYDRYRANLGRGILLGLELLVGADIIGTITAPLTFTSVGLLAIIVLIRTFLSFSLEAEIEGCWPWQRAGRDKDARGGAAR